MRWTHTDAKTMVERSGGEFWEVPYIEDTEICKGDNGDYHLVYSGFKLITYHPDNTFTLRTKGWRTDIVKSRLSEYGPCDVFQRDNEWYLYNAEEPVKFAEDMVVDSFGVPTDEWLTKKIDEEFDQTHITVDTHIYKMYL